MAQAPAAAVIVTAKAVNQNGNSRKMDDMSNHLSSSPRRTAIGKPSLRLSIPTIEQIAETKNQAKLNQTDPGNKKSDSFVKRMIDNCNHSGQLPSNVDIITNNDVPSNSENPADVCDMNRVKSVIEKLDKNKRMSNNNNNGGDSCGSSINSVNGKSPTSEVVPVPAINDDKETTIKLSIDDLTALNLNDGYNVEQNNNDNNNKNNNNEASIPATNDTNECTQLNSFPSYSTFENDFKRRINELSSSSRSDTQTHGTIIIPFPISNPLHPLSQF